MQKSDFLKEDEKYRRLFINNPMPMWIYDRETKAFLEVNEEAIRHYGYSQEEFLSMTIKDIRPSDDIKKLDNLSRTETEYSSIYNGTWQHYKKNGELMHVEITSHLIDYNNRKAALVLINDITEKVRTEELFAYIASHDLKEPLRMITSFLQLFQKKYQDIVDEQGQSYIRFAVDGADRMKKLINDVFEYSTAGNCSEGYQHVDMNEVAEDVLNIFRNRIIKLNAQIKFGPLPVLPNACKSHMLCVLINLVSNALKYRNSEIPEISVNALKQDTHWLFSVKDNGIGFDPVFSEKIFVAFQRLHNRNEYSGTGIGLAVCKKIIQKKGGKIWAESIPGKGSTFYFTVNDQKI